MPYTPFARFLALVIVAIFALALLWPDDRVQIMGLYSLAALPLIVGTFTWNVTRSAAPYDDRAFHRCLPPGPGHAFGRVLWIHLLVLAGVALVVLIHCWIFNFSWRAMSYGIALLALPLWACISVIGLAGSLSATNQHWRSSAWVAIFAAPVFSWGLMYWARTGLDPDLKREVYLTPMRTMVLTAGTLYPLIWWLASVPRQRPLAMIFGAATGALMPWLAIYGDFFKAPDRGERHEMLMARREAMPSPVTLTRKPVPEGEGNWIPVSDLIDVNGLEEGQFATMSFYAQWGGENEREYLPSFEVRDEKDWEHGGIRYNEALAYRSGGKILWGQEAIWPSLRSQLPPHEHFEYWQPALNRPSSPPVILRPGATIPRPNEDRHPLKYSKLTPELFKASPWKAWVSAPMQWSLVGSSDTKRGARLKLRKGGVVKIEPLKETENGHHVIRMRHYTEDLWADGGPWFDEDPEDHRPYLLDLRLLIADESSKRVYAVDLWGLKGETSRKVLLGLRDVITFDAGTADSPEQIQRLEMLGRAKIYLFAASAAGSPKHVELAPP